MAGIVIDLPGRDDTEADAEWLGAGDTEVEPNNRRVDENKRQRG